MNVLSATCDYMTLDQTIKELDKHLQRARHALEKNGGRGMELADEVDRLQLALDALNGELFCTSCEARLTSGRW